MKETELQKRLYSHSQQYVPLFNLLEALIHILSYVERARHSKKGTDYTMKELYNLVNQY